MFAIEQTSDRLQSILTSCTQLASHVKLQHPDQRQRALLPRCIQIHAPFLSLFIAHEGAHSTTTGRNRNCLAPNDAPYYKLYFRMKLFYYKDKVGNFGDDLNPLIWYTLYPDLFSDENDDHIALGIGTLINDRAPPAKKTFVLGSGVGYHGNANVDQSWVFEFVRGPLTAAALGLHSSTSICDPGILISRLFAPATSTNHLKKISFMPHHDSTRLANWHEICTLLDIQYLDPSDDVSETVHRIRNSRFLITEAMHGAIVADAMRVPWVPVVAYPHVLAFKWNDWCQSVGLTYSPYMIPSIWDMEQFNSTQIVTKSALKRILLASGVPGHGWTPPLAANNRKLALPAVIKAFETLIANPPIILSKDQMMAQRLDQLTSAIEKFGQARARRPEPQKNEVGV